MKDTFRYDQHARQEHNLIAQAIIDNNVVFDPEHIPLPPDVVSTFQNHPDRMTEHLIDSYNQAVFHHRKASQATLARKNKEAFNHASLASKFDAVHRKVSRLIESSRVENDGRFNDSDTYYIEVDGVELYFDLMLGWQSDKLMVFNQAEIERFSHESSVALNGSWTHLCAWILEQEHGSERGRPKQSESHPIWRDDRGLLVLRPYINQKYPLLPRALEALRRTLRGDAFESEGEKERRANGEAFRVLEVNTQLDSHA